MTINELYKAALEGKPDAEERLYRQLTVSFRLFAQHRIWHKADSEEIVQDTLVTIISKYKSLRIDSSFSGWSYKVLNNKILDYVKTKRLHAEKLNQYAGDSGNKESWQPDPDLLAQLKNCFTKIHSRHDKHARVLNLHYQGFTTKEICDKMEISPNHLYVILSRARKMLELCLREGEIE